MVRPDGLGDGVVHSSGLGDGPIHGRTVLLGVLEDFERLVKSARELDNVPRRRVCQLVGRRVERVHLAVELLVLEEHCIAVQLRREFDCWLPHAKCIDLSVGQLLRKGIGVAGRAHADVAAGRAVVVWAQHDGG